VRRVAEANTDDRLVWIDLEMTGLEVERDVIVEIACIVTDAELVSTEETIRRVRAVTEADVATAARDLFAPERLSAAGIGPRESRFRAALAHVNPALAERS